MGFSVTMRNRLSHNEKRSTCQRDQECTKLNYVTYEGWFQRPEFHLEYEQLLQNGVLYARFRDSANVYCNGFNNPR